MKRTAIALSLILAAAAAEAKDVAGVKVPDSVSVNNQTLALNGAGIRKKLFIKVYVGALYLAGVCLVPEIIGGWYGVQQFAFGGTSVLIVVSVTMDTVAQIHSHLLAHQYEGLIKKARLRGRR